MSFGVLVWIGGAVARQRRRGAIIVVARVRRRWAICRRRLNMVEVPLRCLVQGAVSCIDLEPKLAQDLASSTLILKEVLNG